MASGVTSVTGAGHLSFPRRGERPFRSGRHHEGMTKSPYSEVVETPIGPLTVTVTEVGVRGVAFGDVLSVAVVPELGPALAGHRAAVRRQIDEYFAGTRRAFDVALDWSAVSGWQETVLRTLHDTVGYGETVGYGRLAAAAGRPEAARAVGRIMAQNPLPVVVPCHRVIAADGSIGGFAGSGGALVELKRRLLELEGSVPRTLF